MALFRRRSAVAPVEDLPTLAECLENLGRQAQEEAAEPLDSSEAQALRERAERRYPASPAGSAFLERAAGALEPGAVHALGMGYALRAGEAADATPSPLPADLSSRVSQASDRAAEADGIARGLARPNPGGPRPEFLSLFRAGPEVWAELEAWIEATGRAASRRRLRRRLAAAGVDAGFDIEPALARISYSGAFRTGYALAACEQACRAGALEEPG